MLMGAELKNGESGRDELELLIPSETVREYVRETGWTFTDFQKAALLYHRGLPLKDGVCAPEGIRKPDG